MATGSRKRMIENTRELVTSTDLNRMQAFQDWSLMEALRNLLNVQGDAGQEVVFTTNSPMRAEVLNGLLPKPIPASANMTVEPGVVLMIDPDAPPLPDDSTYKLVSDPGVLTTAPLTLTQNVSGSTRIDIIECSRVDTILETINVNIYNTSTGTFTPASLPKVGEGRLTYRIRLGTPGSGLPACAAGWLPLAVARVPTGSTTWDGNGTETVTLWDCRPLVSDRVTPTKRSDGKYSEIMYSDLMLDEFLVAGQYRLKGAASGTLNGYRVGGQMLPTSPVSTEVNFIELGNTKHFANGAALVTKTVGYLYFGFPVDPVSGYAYPRWSKYSDTGTRIPRDSRGLVIYDTNAPLGQDGKRTCVVPTATDLGGGVVANAVCFAALYVNDAGPIEFQGIMSRERQHNVLADSNVAAGTPFPTQAVANNGQGTTNVEIKLTPSVHYPAHARKIRVILNYTLAAANVLVNIATNHWSNNAKIETTCEIIIAPTTLMTQTLEIPIESLLGEAGTGLLSNLFFRIRTVATNITFTNCQVVGWDL